MSSTTQFKTVKTPSGKVAFEAYCAVMRWNDQEIMIAAPTREKVAEAWVLCGAAKPLDLNRVQFVWIVEAK